MNSSENFPFGKVGGGWNYIISVISALQLKPFSILIFMFTLDSSIILFGIVYSDKKYLITVSLNFFEKKFPANNFKQKMHL